MSDNVIHRSARLFSTVARTSSSIDITAMRDMDDADDNSVVENLIDDPKLASTRRKPAFQLTAKRLADSVGILGQRAANKFPAGDADYFR